MRYDNNDRLRQYLDRGAAGAYREHMRHPGFEFDATTFAAALGDVRDQHPDLSDDEAEARAAFRLLTSGMPPEVAVALPSRWYRTRAWTRRTAQRAWPWLKLAWALAVLLLAAVAAHAEPPPDAGNAVARNTTLHALLVRPPALLPQLAGGSVAARAQYLNGSNAWTSVSASNPFPITCISGCAGGGGGGGGTSLVDEAAFAEGTTAFTPSGGYYKSSLTALTSGQGGSVALTANRAFHITAYGSGGTELFTSGNAAYVQFPSAQSVSISGTPTVNQGGVPWSVSQSGAWTVQPGNTANTTAWLVTGTGGTFPVTGTFWQATQPVSLTALPSLATGANVIGGVTQSGTWTVQPGNTANTTPWLSTINQGGNSATVTGANALKVDGSAVTQPVSGTFWQSTQPVSVASLPALAAGSNTVGSVKVTDGTNTMVMDPCRGQTKTYTIISQASSSATTLVAGTSAKKTYICELNVVAAAAVNVAIVEGTGTNCSSVSAGVFGGTTAATGWNFAANGGIALGSGASAVGVTATAADNLCILDSGATQVSGNIVTVQQ